MSGEDRDRIVRMICTAGAEAVRRYLDASGEGIETMPEYYLTSMIFNALAADRAVTLETPYKMIHKWLGEEAFELDAKLGRWKPDITIYDGGDKSPYDQKIWGFVEVKRNYIDADPVEGGKRTDRDKLGALANLFRSARPQLICCGALFTERRDYHLQQANKRNDAWFEQPVGPLKFIEVDYFFCARVLS